MKPETLKERLINKLQGTYLRFYGSALSHFLERIIHLFNHHETKEKHHNTL